jgi:signal transduction histidine kinase
MPVKKEKILIVSGEESTRTTVSEIVNRLGFGTATSSHGREALEVLRKETFIVLITDAQMPEMNGFELMKAARTEFPNLAILFMVAPDSGDVGNEAVALGAADYVLKPFTLEEISARLNRVTRDKNIIENLTQKTVEYEIANEELRRLDQLKATFVSNISDELQTPMTVIKEFISLILKGQVGALTEEQKEYLGIANRNVLRLTNLVDKLLDFSRIEAGKGLKLRYKPTRLSEVAEEAIMALSQQAEEKRINVQNRLDPDTPLVLIDRSRLMEVFVNLVGNGIRFTPPGGKVTIDSKGLTEARDYLKVVVTDTGVGISQEDLPKIFERFYQGQRTQEGTVKGTGLGLSISKEIVEGHLGVIRAECKEGGSTSFLFTSPVR